MADDLLGLLDIEPNQPSTDLSSYVIALYGLPKTGKTTFAVDSGECLIYGFEIGYKAIPGAYGYPINSWIQFKNANAKLKNSALKEKYTGVAIDTVGIALQLCEEYICQQNSVSKLSDIPFSKGWKMVEAEFSKEIRNIIREGYGVIIIAHAEEKEDIINKTTKVVIKATNQGRAVINQVADILAYIDVSEGERILSLREPKISEAGTRFSKLPEKIPFNYTALKEAVKDAIIQDAAEKGITYEDHKKTYDLPEQNFDFIGLLDESRALCEEIVNANPGLEKAVVGVIEKNFRKGFDLRTAMPEQSEILSQVVNELKDLKTRLV